MLWQDFLIDRQLDDGAIVEALASAFAVDLAKVHIIHDTVDVTKPESRNAHVVCEVSPVGGDFVLGLQVYVLDERLEQWVRKQDDCNLIGRFCEVADCVALVDDGTANPYSWLLVRNTEDSRPTLLDSYRLEKDEYVVWTGASEEAIAID